ncbi:MAG: hypothetical protein ABIZ91_09530 [Gemmatimonadaceae bacterium]
MTTVFATDEQGQAVAWNKRYGGPPGSGFTRVFSGDVGVGRPTMFPVVQTAAEWRPR